jgi:hypothetical protein
MRPLGNCTTCDGKGILVAVYGKGFRWAPCPPCGGDGRATTRPSTWDAGPVSDWIDATSQPDLEKASAALRAASDPEGQTTAPSRLNWAREVTR